MSVPDRIRALLASFEPALVEVEDDSLRHAQHPGARSGGGHYNLHIVSDAFIGKNTVARHRMIYAALGEMMKGEIHALAIRAQTAEEAKQSN